MSPEAQSPVELSFGAAYDRLQQIAAELGRDGTMAPDRLIALLREGKGLERALRDHLERVEQEVRAIEDGDGAVPFRIVDAVRAPDAAGSGAVRRGAEAPGTAVREPSGAPSAGSASSGDAGPRERQAPSGSAAPDVAPRDSGASADRAGAIGTSRPVAPTLGFLEDDDIPF